MKHKFFPNSILQCIVILLLFFGFNAIIVSTLGFFIENIDIKITLNFLISCLCTLTVIFFLNKKKAEKLNICFKINNYSLLFFSLLLVISYQISISTPLFKAILVPLFNINIGVASNPFENLFFILSTVIIAPILEEILFRGVFLRGLLLKNSAIKSILISTLLFALIHFLPAHIINAFILGVFFGFIYYKTKSIGYTIILHITVNLTSLFGGYINYKFGKATIYAITDIYGGLSLYIIFFSILIFIYSGIKITQLTIKPVTSYKEI